METPASPSSLKPHNPISIDSNPTVEDNPPSSKPMINKKKKKKRVFKDVSAMQTSLSSCASSSSSYPSSRKGAHVGFKRRNPKVLFGAVRGNGGGDVEAIALPLGMSFAAVVAQVLERKDAASERMSVDHLSMICTSAVRESLANVFGDKFDCFARNFEKSFGSTLRTLRLINESSMDKGGYHLGNLNIESSMSDVTFKNKGGCTSNSCINNCYSEVDWPDIATQNRLSTPEEVQEDSMNQENTLHGQTNLTIKNSKSDTSKNNGGCISNSGINDCHSETDWPAIAIFSQSNTPKDVQEKMSKDQELALLGQTNQLVCVTSTTLGSVTNQSRLSTIEKSVMEQVRSNDLKTLELGLTMKRLKLKETQVALNYDSNHLERSKLAMGISKASFKAEKFKNQLEDMRHVELLKKCIDCLVAGLLIMSISLSYGAYVFSYTRITEATAACAPLSQESKSWWIPKPMASFNSGLNLLKCQAQVLSRMLFGIFMIVAIAYLLLQRSATSKQTMPVTFLLLLLGIACGFAGRLCVDTLGGRGYHWLLYWEVLCLLHFFANACTSALFFILYGPVAVSQGMKGNTMIPYWMRRLLFYATVLLFLPLLCGLMPFASPVEWKDHFFLLVTDFLSVTGD